MDYPTVSRSQARLDEALEMWIDRAQEKERVQGENEEFFERMERAALVVQAAFQQWFMDAGNVGALEGVAEQRMNRVRRTHPDVARAMDKLMFGVDESNPPSKPRLAA